MRVEPASYDPRDLDPDLDTAMTILCKYCEVSYHCWEKLRLSVYKEVCWRFRRVVYMKAYSYINIVVK